MLNLPRMIFTESVEYFALAASISMPVAGGLELPTPFKRATLIRVPG